MVKETRCCCSNVRTCVDAVQDESTKIFRLAALAPVLEDVDQTVVHVAVSIDCRPVQKRNSGEHALPSHRKKPSSDL